MLVRAACAVIAVLWLGGCAATTPPPRFSTVSPADADAPEGASPPAAPTLSAEPEAQGRPRPTPTPAPAHHHHGGRP